MTSLMVKINGRSSYVSCKEVFDDTRSSKLRLAADCGECRAGGESLCGLLLSPAESAKQAINTSNLK